MTFWLVDFAVCIPADFATAFVYFLNVSARGIVVADVAVSHIAPSVC
jgi:hypothetical protein